MWYKSKAWPLHKLKDFCNESKSFFSRYIYNNYQASLSKKKKNEQSLRIEVVLLNHFCDVMCNILKILSRF